MNSLLCPSQQSNSKQSVMIQQQMSKINLDCRSKSTFTFPLDTDRSRKDRFSLIRKFYGRPRLSGTIAPPAGKEE